MNKTLTRLCRTLALGLLPAVLFALAIPTAQAQQSDPEARQIIRLLCMKHGIRTASQSNEAYAACDAFAGFVTAPPLMLGSGSGMLDALFDPEYESEQVAELAARLGLPERDLAAAVYDYRVWELARQAAGRAPLRSAEHAPEP